MRDGRVPEVGLRGRVLQEFSAKNRRLARWHGGCTSLGPCVLVFSWRTTSRMCSRRCGFCSRERTSTPTSSPPLPPPSAACSSSPYELLLADLNYTRDTTSAGEGLELVSRARGLDPHLPVVVMTGWGTIDTAVEAMRRGARSFVQKPWNNTTLLEILAREIEDGRVARQQNVRHEREQADARAIQRGLLPATLPCDRAVRHRSRVASGQRLRRRLLRRAHVRRRRARVAHRGRGGQGSSRRAAHVEPAGRRARVLGRRRVALRRSARR